MSEDRPGNQLGLPGGRSPMGPAGAMRDLHDDLMSRAPPRGGPDELGLKRQHDFARAMYDKLKESRGMLDHIRIELDKLTSLGDAVTHSDVMGAAGRLVGHGVPAKEMATLLADMPLGAGQGLAAWLQMHDMGATQQEALVDRLVGTARHRMGVAALKELAGEHVMEPLRGQRAAAGPLGAQPRPTPGVGMMPQTSVMQVAQRPEMQGPGAEEAA